MNKSFCFDNDYIIKERLRSHMSDEHVLCFNNDYIIKERLRSHMSDEHVLLF